VPVGNAQRTGLYVAFFASGGGALIFETLWFRQCALALGGTVWASGIVLAAFMTGLAAGNALAPAIGARFRHPINAYAAAELVVALTGTALVVSLPHAVPTIAVLFTHVLDRPLLVNAVRLCVAFLLLVVPSTAMGVTLPMITRALSASDLPFGSLLGRLYGTNTLGAVAGAIASETFLIGHVGIQQTAIAGGLLTAVGGLAALSTARGLPLSSEPASKPRMDGGATWIAAAFASGCALLSLEIVWSRTLALYVLTDTLAFAMMLGTALAGIGIGGVTAARWLDSGFKSRWSAAAAALAASVGCAGSYAVLPWTVPVSADELSASPLAILRVAVPLALPSALASGALFVFLAAAFRDAQDSDVVAASRLVCANTIGSAVGALLASFVLLPTLGIERSIFAIAAVYAVLAVILVRSASRAWLPSAVVGAVALGSLACIPTGTVARRLAAPPAMQWDTPSFGVTSRVHSIREGLNETTIYIESALFGTYPVSYTMLTNGYSMSSTKQASRRYMKLFAYWPVAVRPSVARVLLIAFGVGNTAKAFTDTASVQRLDIVDVSSDVLAMSRVGYSGTDNPLCDPRVHVHVEDGRFFLQTRADRFDVITGEPPPPRIAGVVNLYTREYFQLLFDHLNDGGVVTYWLPMSELSAAGAKSVVRAFCAVFEDCSLWHGMGTNLMLAGTRGASEPSSITSFVRQWSEPRVAPELRQLGFEHPEQLGALFIADGPDLRVLVSGADALVDDHPKLIDAPASNSGEWMAFVGSVTDERAAAARFARSAFIRRLWPRAMIAATQPYFEYQALINAHFFGIASGHAPGWSDVHDLLTRSDLQAPVLWDLGSDADLQRAIAAATSDHPDDPIVQLHLGLRRLALRDYEGALEPLQRAVDGIDDHAARQHAIRVLAYVLCRVGDFDDARAFVGSFGDSWPPADPFLHWIQETFPLGLSPL
jgi:spermidine synthase